MDIVEADGVVAQFCNVTMATPEQARFYLESSEWHLQPALQLYFDADTGHNCATSLTNLEDYDLSEEEESMSTSSVPVGLQLAHDHRNNNNNNNVNNNNNNNNNVMSRRDFGKCEEDLELSHGPQDTSTMMGHERSGMMVQDPTKKHKHDPDMEAIFQGVRNLRAQEAPSMKRSEVEASGATDNEQSINKADCADQHIMLNRSEDLETRAEPKYVAFQGHGHKLEPPARTLGAGTSETDTDDAPRPSTRTIVAFDSSKPSTSIQVRLMDGTRTVGRFNTTHTIADIRSFIDAAQPGSSTSYQLQTVGLPPKRLTNLKQTIEGAGLLNAVVIQKG